MEFDNISDPRHFDTDSSAPVMKSPNSQEGEGDSIVFTCRGCHNEKKILSVKEFETESFCPTCADDTEWIRDEIQDETSTCFTAAETGSFTGDSKVRLRVGGKVFTTTVRTLLDAEPDSIFAAMFSNQFSLTSEGEQDAAGCIAIDRPAKWFATILEFCRQGNLAREYEDSELDELEEEACYYCMDTLRQRIACMRFLRRQKRRLKEKTERKEREERERRERQQQQQQQHSSRFRPTFIDPAQLPTAQPRRGCPAAVNAAFSSDPLFESPFPCFVPVHSTEFPSEGPGPEGRSFHLSSTMSPRPAFPGDSAAASLRPPAPGGFVPMDQHQDILAQLAAAQQRIRDLEEENQRLRESPQPAQAPVL